MTATATLPTGTFEFVAASGRRYTMTIAKRGRGTTIRCSCPGFSRWNHCKHADAAREGRKFVKTANRVEKESTVKKTKSTKQPAATSKVRQYTCGSCGTLGHNARSCTTTAKVKATTKTKTVRTKRLPFPTDVPVNVKVTGERTMRKSVILVQHPTKVGVVMVKTGGRGRPSNLPVENIVRVSAL